MPAPTATLGISIDFHDVSPPYPAVESADHVVLALVPKVSATILERLRREELQEADLIELDNADLRQLGFSLSERSRILRWSRATRRGGLTPMSVRPGAGLDLARSIAGTESSLKVPEVAEELARIRTLQVSPDVWCVYYDPRVMQRILQSSSIQFLSKLSGNGNCKTMHDLVEGSRRDRSHVSLEKFNVTQPRLLKVFLSMLKAEGTKEDADTEDIYTIEQFQAGLTALHLDDLDSSSVRSVFDLIRGLGGISYQEFSTACTRLKLAQVVGFLESRSLYSEMRLDFIDFDLDNRFASASLSEFQDLRHYLFSRRGSPLLPGGSLYGSTRWIHITGHKALLIAVMVKYNLNPLAIEGMLQEGPTKVDFHGDTSLITIDHLSLIHDSFASSEPVQVEGSYISILLSGSPFSTVCTVIQPSKSFEQDWPGAQIHEDGTNGISNDAWLSRTRAVLKDAEKRASRNTSQSLLLDILTQITEDQVQLTHAYSDRLVMLEKELGHELEKGNVPSRSWPSEVMQSQQKLHLVNRQIKLMRHAIHRIINAPALTMNGHLAPNFSELYELLDGCRAEIENCMARADYMVNSYNLALNRKREAEEKIQRDRETHHAERQNKVMFIMSATTVIFAPVQFMSGVYGMNFRDLEMDQPAIPELVDKNGYYYFWIGVMVYLVACFSTACLWWRRSQFQNHGPSRATLLKEEFATRKSRVFE